MFFRGILPRGRRGAGDVFVAYRVLQCYRRRRIQRGAAGELGSHADAAVPDSMAGWYRLLCYQIRNAEPRGGGASTHEIEALVRGVVADVQALGDADKRTVLPLLVVSLAAQRSVRAGRFARPLFEQLADLSAPEDEEEEDGGGEGAGAGRLAGLDPSFLEHLLAQARYLRRDDLPYPQILRRIVQSGRRPRPWHAVAVLDNLHPFLEADLDDVKVALRALVDLQTAASPQPGLTAEEEARRSYRYAVDPSALEAIGASAARHGDLELSLLVWDAANAATDPLDGGETPVGVYENLVLVFCARPEQYGSAFTVLAEMEDRGYAPSRALIRGVSARLRYGIVFFLAKNPLSLRGFAPTGSDEKSSSRCVLSFEWQGGPAQP
jgi:hypothetical protein